MYYRYERKPMKDIWEEHHGFDLWLKVEIAAAVAWAELGVVPKEDAEKIRGAKFDRDLYDKWFEETKHDLVSFTRSVTPSLGPEGRWIHHGLTSNDVKDTALSLQMVEAVDLLDQDVDRLMAVLKARAEEFSSTPCMGRSHGVHAEPMSFGLKMALWWDEMRRHKARLALAREMVAVGMISGPVGSYASIPPDIEESVCRQLDLTPAPVSNQIIQRDRHAQFVQTLALIAASLEKFATEIRALQRTEVREVEEPFGTPGFVSTGSSSMPHKRNPELSERVCGLARLVRGYTITALDNVTLWHERDISHSSAERMILPDSALAVDYILDTFTRIVEGMRVFPEQMMRNLEITKGIVFSERVLLALVESGLDRTSAYELVQRHALTAWDNNEDFRESIKADSEVTSRLGVDKVSGLFDYGYYLRHVNRTFSRLGFAVKESAGATA
ncbi:MAG: adenylosuccinate lyase [Chloroflexi bacterium]|nr:adenylosuccinate lyase [Chloroflexota bacterium]